jgi:TPR repeat protein
MMPAMKRSHLLLGSSLVLAGAALAWTAHTPAAPAAAQIEATAMAAAQTGDAQAHRRLREWARGGSPVAERELGILYRAQPARRAEAQQLLLQAARAGDAEAAFQLGELLRVAPPGVPASAAQAAPWYRQAAAARHAKAALTLGQMARNGDGLPRDEVEAARWLSLASELGNAHAMFLLSNAYRYGLGVTRDPVRGRELLEEAAEHEYPPALQDLALAVQDEDAQRASHLFKEASEHRRNNWNRY